MCTILLCKNLCDVSKEGRSPTQESDKCKLLNVLERRYCLEFEHPVYVFQGVKAFAACASRETHSNIAKLYCSLIHYAYKVM